MTLRRKIIIRLPLFVRKKRVLDPYTGYQYWAERYESKGNLMHLLDSELVEDQLAGIDLNGKTVLDVGCGTGRYYSRFRQAGVGRWMGCDLAPAMLERLRVKYPEAEVYEVIDHRLPFLVDRSVDLLFSTLAIGHLPVLAPYVQEWARVLRPGGMVLFTGNHPDALRYGAERTFGYRGQTLRIRNYIHSFRAIRSLLNACGWREIAHEERAVGPEHRAFFENQNALASYRLVAGQPIIYLMRWQQSNH